MALLARRSWSARLGLWVSSVGFVGFFVSAAGMLGCSRAEREESVEESSKALTAPAWQPGRAYRVGDLVSYGGKLYRVVQAHSSQLAWTPEATGALFAFEGSDTGSNETNPTRPPETLSLDYVASQADCNNSPASCCAPGSTFTQLSAENDVHYSTEPSRCVSAGPGNDTVYLQSSGPSSLLLGAGDDIAMDGAGDDLIWGGYGRDTINGYGGTNLFFGGYGDDTILAANGKNTVIPGPGLDVVALGTGDDTLYVFDVCELAVGERLAGGAGNDTLITPVALEELRARGVVVEGFENVRVEGNSCRSECSVRPRCGHGRCAEGQPIGTMTCDCQEGFAGVECATPIEGRSDPDPRLPPSPLPRSSAISTVNAAGPGYFAAAPHGIVTFGAAPRALAPPDLPVGYRKKSTTGLLLSLETTLPGEGWPEGNNLHISSSVGADAELLHRVPVTNEEPRDRNVYRHRAIVTTQAPVRVTFQEVEYNDFSDHESVKAELDVDVSTGAITGFIESAKISKTWVFPLPVTVDSYQVVRHETVNGRLGEPQTFRFHGDNEVTWRIDQDDVVSGDPVRVCGRWNAYFVEDQSIGQPGSAQIYPAAFAKFEFQSEGIGATYRSSGQLDGEGCLPDLVPIDALAYPAREASGETSLVWLKLTSDFKIPAGSEEGKVPLTLTGNSDFVTAALLVNNFSNPHPLGAWTRRDEHLLPPEKLELAPAGEDDSTSAAAMLSTTLRRIVDEGIVFDKTVAAKMDSDLKAGPRDYSCRKISDAAYDSKAGTLVFGSGFVPRADGFECECTEASTCDGYPCVGGVCAVHERDFSHAKSCSSENNDCPATQFCASRSNLVANRTPSPCASGEESCVCAHRAQAAWKFIGAHEFGHAVQSVFVGSNIAGTDYGFACLPDTSCADQGSPTDFYDGGGVFVGRGLADPPNMAPLCGCAHVESANGLHCLQSIEGTPQAQGEGFAHFFAALVWNDPTQSSCDFRYYKEYRNEAGQILSPPIFIPCATPVAWRNKAECVVDPATTTTIYNNTSLGKPLMGTERDWLTFLYSLRTSGISFPDILSIFRRAVSTYSSPGSDEPTDLRLFSGQGIYWLDDSSLGQFGFLDGARRKWGDQSETARLVAASGTQHGVSEVVP